MNTYMIISIGIGMVSRKGPALPIRASTRSKHTTESWISHADKFNGTICVDFYAQ